VEDEWSVLGRSSIPDRVCQQMLRHTEPGVRETRDAPGVGVSKKYEAGVGALQLPHGHGQVHTCGMQVCELTAVALTAAPLLPPRSPRRARASTSPWLA